jgi:5-methylcytosine-specific restriction endonuclease McrBC regulatory subunit McrC
MSEKLTKYRVQSQYSVELGRSGFDFIIDLVIKEIASGEVKFVMDTKYERRHEPLLSEIQQIVAYAVRMETASGFLIYPSRLTKPFSIPVGDITAKSLVFDLSEDIEKAGNTFIQEIESL